MHTADIIPLIFVGGVLAVLMGRLISSFLKAKLV